jgi:type II secretory pathway component HofQ
MKPNRNNLMFFSRIVSILAGGLLFFPQGFVQETPSLDSSGFSQDEMASSLESAIEEAMLQEAADSLVQTGESSQENGSEQAPVLRIDQLDQDHFSMEFRNLDIGDLLRVVAHNYNLNILVDPKVKGTVTASFSNVTLDEALDVILSNNNLLLEKHGSILKVSPNLVSKVFLLNHIEAKDLLAGGGSSSGDDSLQSSPASGEANTIFDLLSEDGQMFLGKMPNSILVIDYPLNIQKVSQYVRVVDRKMASKVFKLKHLSVNEIVESGDEAE